MTTEHNFVDGKRTIPVYLFSGFLGSGKTTLLSQVIDYYKAGDVKAAVIMNELGEVNLDGQLVDEEVPMAEMLSGCICCTIRGDLSLEIKMLIDEHQPDVILIESTGAANPLEIIDAVTETAIYARIDLRKVVTVVDGPELLARSRRGGRTYKLMQDQIRCATDLVINKADKINPEELVEIQQLVRELNAYAPLTVTIRCATDMDIFDISPHEGMEQARSAHGQEHHSCGANCSHEEHDHIHEYEHEHRHGNHCGHEHHEHSHDDAECKAGSHHSHDAAGHKAASHHHSHEHVMTLTHYLSGPIDSHAFEAVIAELPQEVYRAKGIVTFADTNSRFLFQYVYRETEFTRITPQGKVNDVVVFIGEHFAKDELEQRLIQLDR